MGLDLLDQLERDREESWYLMMVVVKESCLMGKGRLGMVVGLEEEDR